MVKVFRPSQQELNRCIACATQALASAMRDVWTKHGSVSVEIGVPRKPYDAHEMVQYLAGAGAVFTVTP